MEQPSILDKLDNIQIGAPVRILVCFFDGFVLKAAIMHASVYDVEVEFEVESRLIDYADAVVDVVTQLKSLVKRLPKKAILVSSSAVAALLDLPVNPDEPRPDAQMQELVRWELESIFAQQSELWPIGILLGGRGYLSPEQKQNVIQEANTGASHPGTKRDVARFGELAIRLGYITQDQIDECLALQEKLVLIDDEIECAWAAQQTGYDDAERYNWLVSGVGKSYRAQWARAFQRQGIFLEWIYPTVGTAFTALGLQNKNKDLLLLESRQRLQIIMRGQPGRLAAMLQFNVKSEQFDSKQLSALCSEQLQPGLESIHILFKPDIDTETRNEIAESTQRKIIELKDLYDSDACLVGAMVHHTGKVSEYALARVRAQPPQQALWKRRDLWPYAAAALIVISLIIYHISQCLVIYANEQRLIVLDKEFGDKLDLKNKIESTNSVLLKIQDNILQHKKMLKRAEKHYQQLDNFMQRREDLPVMLRQIASSLGQKTILDKLEESEKINGLYLEGWTISVTDARLFFSKLNQSLLSLQLRVENEEINIGQKRFGIDGYNIRLQLVKFEQQKKDSR